jgi:hypothetical protein
MKHGFGGEKRARQTLLVTLRTIQNKHKWQRKAGPGRKSNAEHAIHFCEYALESLGVTVGDNGSLGGADEESANEEGNNSDDDDEQESVSSSSDQEASEKRSQGGTEEETDEETKKAKDATTTAPEQGEEPTPPPSNDGTASEKEYNDGKPPSGSRGSSKSPQDPERRRKVALLAQLADAFTGKMPDEDAGRGKRSRRQPKIYTEQVAVSARNWQSDEVYFSSSEDSSDEDDDEEEDDSSGMSTRHDVAEGEYWCNFCRDDPLVKM